MKNKLFIIAGFLAALLIGHSNVSAQEADAELTLAPSVAEARIGDEFEVDVMLRNPGAQNVISVRAWLEYNSDVLEGVSIDTANSPFTLSAPGETEFSPNEGFVKIGRSNISGGFSGTEVKVATVRFRVKTPYYLIAQIEPYDYQVTELGHTSVNIVDQGFPINILSEEPEAASVVLNPGAEPYGDQETDTGVIVDVTAIGFANLQRPQNLRVMTGPGYVDLKWDLSTEPELVGYNLYYGKTSGMYTRRRSVGMTNQYRLDGLHNNEVYYFAVTAYDGQNRESDYSDEVAVIINEPLSSTSPFEEFVASLLARIPMQPQNGPLVGWLAFSAMGLGGTLAFRKKKIN